MELYYNILNAPIFFHTSIQLIGVQAQTWHHKVFYVSQLSGAQAASLGSHCDLFRYTARVGVHIEGEVRCSG